MTNAATISGLSSAPAFSVYQNTAQGSLVSATDTKVIFDTKEFDTANNFNVSTSTFTPTIAGYYQLNSCVRVDGAQTRIILSLFKNGGLFRHGNDISNAAGINNVGSFLVYANGTTDYFNIYIYASGSSPALSSGGTNIWFSGCLARGA